MSAPKVVLLVGGGPLDGSVMPVTRRLANGSDVVQMRSQVNATKAHVYQRDEGERDATYRGLFVTSIDVNPDEGSDDEPDEREAN